MWISENRPAKGNRRHRCCLFLKGKDSRQHHCYRTDCRQKFQHVHPEYLISLFLRFFVFVYEKIGSPERTSRFLIILYQQQKNGCASVSILRHIKFFRIINSAVIIIKKKSATVIMADIAKSYTFSEGAEKRAQNGCCAKTVQAFVFIFTTPSANLFTL